MSPKIVNKEQRKREIALAALELFARNGFERTAVDDIARAAGISKGGVYLYFESKEDLFFSAVSAWAALKLTETDEAIAGAAAPPDRLRAVVHSMVDAFIPDPQFMQVAVDMLRLFLMNPEFYQKHELTRELFQSSRKRIVDALLDGVSQGVFRPGIANEAEKIAINLVAYLDGIGLHYYMSKDYFDLKEQVDSYLDGLLQSIEADRGRDTGR